MSPLVRLTAGAIFAVLALGGPARADMRTMPAKQLVLNEAMAGDTTIEVDSTLSGQVRVSMDEGLDCLVMVESETMVIDASRCGDHDLRVAVPQGLPIVLNASGGGNIKIGDVDGPLTLSLSGHGDVSAGRTAQLLINLNGGSDVSVGAVSGSTVLNLSGSGDLKLKSLDGPLVLKKNGSGDVAIGSINAPGVEVEDSGSGDVILGAGTIGSLRVNLNGSSDFATAATIRDADLNAHGGGDMRVGKVTGTIRRNASGGSEIRNRHVGHGERHHRRCRQRYQQVQRPEDLGSIRHLLDDRTFPDDRRRRLPDLFHLPDYPPVRRRRWPDAPAQPGAGAFRADPCGCDCGVRGAGPGGAAAGTGGGLCDIPGVRSAAEVPRDGAVVRK